ncbi:MAG: deoxyguanosinetriphosphate triphosphohydrolase [Eubacteriales bacterium]|nr:deoxyguanosinetriphosphate triphosphohydrolase [Eubacteriales bacterium]
MREDQEQLERQTLVPWATLSADSRGRQRKIPECPRRTCFQRDRDRIVHCKAFRRLGNKTQVFISPEGDHYRDRLTHTLEVAQIARTVARSLRLNEDLTEAIALGHDLGHTPFGHVGERTLDRLCRADPEKADVRFRHNEQSLRVVDYLERDGEGLNLTQEVRDGIVCHTGTAHAATPEGRIVHFADRIAYVNHDIDDAVRAGLIVPEELPQEAVRVLGDTHGDRIDTMVADMVRYGEEQQEIGMYDKVHDAMMALRSYLFDAVYALQSQEERIDCVLTALFEYYLRHLELLPALYKRRIEPDGERRAVCDYIAGMTDRFAVEMYTELFIPRSWNIK